MEPRENGQKDPQLFRKPCNPDRYPTHINPMLKATAQTHIVVAELKTKLSRAEASAGTWMLKDTTFLQSAQRIQQ
jgi:hypothetical protein